MGVTHTTEELIEMASEVDVVDGPNDEGEMFERPAKLSDPLPRPYDNEVNHTNTQLFYLHELKFLFLIDF